MSLKHILTCAGKGAKAVGSTAKSFGAFTKNNASHILFAAGTIAICCAVTKAIIDAPKVKEDLDEAKAVKGKDLTKKEKAKVAAKRLWPVAALTAVGIGSYAGVHIIDVRECVRTAAEVETLRRGYSELSEKYSDVQEAASEVLSADDKKKLDDRIADKQIEKHPLSRSQIIETESGESIFIETQSGQKFKASKQFIDNAVNRFNRKVVNDGFAPFNDFLDELRIQRAGPWADDRGYGRTKSLLEVVRYEGEEIEPGVFAAAIRYREAPYEEYKTWY